MKKNFIILAIFLAMGLLFWFFIYNNNLEKTPPSLSSGTEKDSVPSGTFWDE